MTNGIATTIGKFAFHESGLKTVKLDNVTYMRYRTVNDDQSNTLLQISNLAYPELTKDKKSVRYVKRQPPNYMIPFGRNSITTDQYYYIDKIFKDNLFTDTNEVDLEQWNGDNNACYDKGLVTLNQYLIHDRDKCDWLEKHDTKHDSDSILDKQKNNTFTGVKWGYIRFPRNCTYIRNFDNFTLSDHNNADNKLRYALNDNTWWKHEDPLNRGFGGAGLISRLNGIYSDYPVRNAVKKFYHGNTFAFVNICIGYVKNTISPYLMNEYKNITSIKNVFWFTHGSLELKIG